MDEQLTFFGKAGQSKGIPDGLITYFPELFGDQESRVYLKSLINATPWEQRAVMMYGNKIVTPRLTAWYGDAEKNYAYSGNRFQPLQWTADLLEIKRKVEPLAGVIFNSVLLNYYRDSNDSVAWHSDNEAELGKQPVIASVSFGQVRQFDIRRKDLHNERYSIRLEEGSLLLMKGDLQQHWEHRISKSTIPMKPRVNLTFRVIN